MKLLLDTHAFLWLVAGSSQLSSAAARAIADDHNDLYLSVASVWEVAIKSSLGKLSLRDPLDVFVTTWTTTYQIRLQAILAPHAICVATMPYHPFDRLLIAQAITEEMTILTADRRFSEYDAAILW